MSDMDFVAFDFEGHTYRVDRDFLEQEDCVLPSPDGRVVTFVSYEEGVPRGVVTFVGLHVSKLTVYREYIHNPQLCAARFNIPLAELVL